MKKVLVTLTLLVGLIIAGCSNDTKEQTSGETADVKTEKPKQVEPIDEKEYEEFLKTFQNGNFTGFAFILYSYDINEQGIVPDVFKEPFKKANATLTFVDLYKEPDEVRHKYGSDDSHDPILNDVSDNIVYMKNGEPIAKIEVEERLEGIIEENEYKAEVQEELEIFQKELRAFIDKYKNYE
ncbi:hypothetical protein [Bacillus sp. V2I10]|uniref:hypothetical protein n=1 Tax=Bacillus sp. V2I10 TaxID=3042276 RepID=UPI00278A3F5E|nr:hypothetical protein [Bacillus sp. V2I10]MDQ0859811.1 hypothetical protein [Bacillus sp. V2I10]